jgi:hypothetical protein
MFLRSTVKVRNIKLLAKVQALSLQLLTEKAHLQARSKLWGICGGQFTYVNPVLKILEVMQTNRHEFC